MIGTLVCTTCGAALSGPVKIHSTKNPATRQPEFVDQRPLTSVGEAIKSWDPMQQSLDPANPAKLEFTPQYWMNPEDTEHAVEKVSDLCRLNGCCGLDEIGGPNMQCKQCKSEVGTRQSDCWTADVFIPEPGQTDWIEVTT